MRIAIVGQFGIGNVGDEGILQAIMDSLGLEHDCIVITTLPFNIIGTYKSRIPNAVDLRTIDDTRTDFDVCLYGGGKIDWGFGWGYFIRAFNANKKTMAYGISLRTDQYQKLGVLYSAFFSEFNKITIRDMVSKKILDSILTLKNPIKLTMCPAINLKEEKASSEGTIAVCPRYGDYNEKGEVDNTAQVDWFVKRLAPYHRKSITLIPFHPKDLEGSLRDLELCQTINKRLGGGCNIFPSDGFNARKVKYAIANSELVLSGGRYHAIVWAMAYDIPYGIAPTVTGIAKAKLDGLVEMYDCFGSEKLMRMELENKKMFEAMF